MVILTENVYFPHIEYFCIFALCHSTDYTNYTQGACDPGWIQYGSQCYQFNLQSSDKISHQMALTSCVSRGAMLASISEQSQQEFLLEYLQVNQPNFGDPMWIGLYQKTPKDPFRWEDGSKVAFVNWGCGEPNDHGGSEDCTQIGWGTGNFQSTRWNDDSCGKNFHYICQKDAPSRKGLSGNFF